jgi:hypothetical protein
VPGWAWIVIAIVIVAVVASVLWAALGRRRTARLRQQFGPEYGRTLESAQSKRDAEAELQAREERRSKLEIRPLSQTARARYMENWQAIQAQFVDAPVAAVESADGLIQSLMAERGYPMEDFEQRAADISVDHPEVVENYREGHRLAQDTAGAGRTESLRNAMRHYRTLFEQLLEPDADEPIGRDSDRAAPARSESGVR